MFLLFENGLLESTVGIVIPTCNSTLFEEVLLPSIEYIKEISHLATFLINFNGPDWNSDNIDRVVLKLFELGFNVRYDYTGIWEKPIPIIRMREICAGMGQDNDLFLFIDDDFRFVERTDKYPFSSGQRYLHSIDYMTRFPECGVTNTKSFLGGTPFKLRIIPTRDAMYATNRGLFLRNMKKHGFLLAPKDTHNLRGGLEETLMAMSRIELGYFCACQYNNPTVHITGVLEDYDEDESDFHNMGIIDNNVGRYLREKYNNWHWKYSEKKFPNKLWDLYKENGGFNYSYKDPRLTFDYADFEDWDDSIIKPANRRRK